MLIESLLTDSFLTLILSKWNAYDDIINNNPIEAFNGQFKAWYKPKRGFKSFDSCKSSDFPFVFFYKLCQTSFFTGTILLAASSGWCYVQ